MLNYENSVKANVGGAREKFLEINIGEDANRLPVEIRSGFVLNNHIEISIKASCGKSDGTIVPAWKLLCRSFLARFLYLVLQAILSIVNTPVKKILLCLTDQNFPPHS